jgi:hypothetical protein
MDEADYFLSKIDRELKEEVDDDDRKLAVVALAAIAIGMELLHQDPLQATTNFSLEKIVWKHVMCFQYVFLSRPVPFPALGTLTRTPGVSPMLPLPFRSLPRDFLEPLCFA